MESPKSSTFHSFKVAGFTLGGIHARRKQICTRTFAGSPTSKQDPRVHKNVCGIRHPQEKQFAGDSSPMNFPEELNIPTFLRREKDHVIYKC